MNIYKKRIFVCLQFVSISVQCDNATIYGPTVELNKSSSVADDFHSNADVMCTPRICVLFSALHLRLSEGKEKKKEKLEMFNHCRRLHCVSCTKLFHVHCTKIKIATFNYVRRRVYPFAFHEVCRRSLIYLSDYRRLSRGVPVSLKLLSAFCVRVDQLFFFRLYFAAMFGKNSHFRDVFQTIRDSENVQTTSHTYIYELHALRKR